MERNERYGRTLKGDRVRILRDYDDDRYETEHDVIPEVHPIIPKRQIQEIVDETREQIEQLKR